MLCIAGAGGAIWAELQDDGDQTTTAERVEALEREVDDLRFELDETKRELDDAKTDLGQRLDEAESRIDETELDVRRVGIEAGL